MKTDYNRARADMSPRTLTEIRKGANAGARGKCLSCLYGDRPQQLSTTMTRAELEEAKQQALKYYRR